MKKHLLFSSFVLLISLTIVGQKPQKLTSNEIYEKLQKLNFLGTALYIAAHPDDENTRLISYLSNHVKARTGYLSLTRGDGGQNLIGPELRELLGVIRTQELLAARGIDGGEQFFTRANDFGYSKHPEETLKIWDKEKVLSDVVWTIRNFKPDVIINRFNHRTPGTTHGHHTSSAMLSVEAFEMAKDSSKFESQLNLTDVWQPKRLFFNTSSWFYRNQAAFEADTKDKLTALDVGVYYPLKGKSNNEIAAIASSQHLCQGFGRLSTRGSQSEYLEFLKGEPLKDKNDIFSGINTTWNRIEGGGEIGDILYEIEENFNFINPSKHIPALLSAYQEIKNLNDDYWRNIKEQQIKEVIEACAGLYLEASASSATATPNSKIEVLLEAVNRSSVDVVLSSVTSTIDENIMVKEADLTTNKRFNFKEIIQLKTSNYTDPYWLRKSASLGMYSVANQKLIGKPETPRASTIDFNLVIENVPITFTKNLVRRYAERDKGEIYEPFEIVPLVTTKLRDKVLIFSDATPREVAVSVKAGSNFASGEVRLELPEDWQVMPEKAIFNIAQKNDQQTITFLVTPSKNESTGQLKAIATFKGKEYQKELVEIQYNHIPKQTVLLNSEAKVVRLNIQKAGNTIGYIRGAGDAIPENLSQIGYDVTEINPNDISTENLQKFDAIVMGIRAYNVVDQLKFKQKYLLEFVEQGGNLIVQYNTNRGVDVGAPYSLKLSRDRVTDETAEVLILDETHELFNYPNKITSEDFNNWVQERGLYFPNIWSSEYAPLLSMNDKGETPKLGSLLIANYGKGHYIYTGLSFFRELPAGVVGAYKLFVNMLSVGKEKNKQESQSTK